MSVPSLLISKPEMLFELTYKYCAEGEDLPAEVLPVAKLLLGDSVELLPELLLAIHGYGCPAIFHG